MKFYDKDGVEVEATQFSPDSLVVVRVTKLMGKKEFADFCRCNDMLMEPFRKRGIQVIFCPDWVEFKEWK